MLLCPVKAGKSSSPGRNAETQKFLTHVSSAAFSHRMRDAHNQSRSGNFVSKSTLITSFSSVFRALHSSDGKSRLCFHFVSAPLFIICMISVKGRERALNRDGRLKHAFAAELTQPWQQLHSHFFLKSEGLKGSQPDSGKCLRHHEHLIRNKL